MVNTTTLSYCFCCLLGLMMYLLHAKLDQSISKACEWTLWFKKVQRRLAQGECPQPLLTPKQPYTWTRASASHKTAQTSYQKTDNVKGVKYWLVWCTQQQKNPHKPWTQPSLNHHHTTSSFPHKWFNPTHECANLCTSTWKQGPHLKRQSQDPGHHRHFFHCCSLGPRVLCLQNLGGPRPHSGFCLPLPVLVPMKHI